MSLCWVQNFISCYNKCVVRCIIKRTKVTAQLNEEFLNCPRLFISHFIDVVFVPFVRFIWNTQLSFSNSHFQPTPFPNLFNAPSLTLLICFSLSLCLSVSLSLCLSVSLSPSSAYSPLYLYLPSFDINRKSICVYHWTKLFEWTRSFTWRLHTINVIMLNVIMLSAVAPSPGLRIEPGTSFFLFLFSRFNTEATVPPL